MANQKLETLLNVSMQATQEDRAKSPDLSAGVDEEAGIWEIIVKYTQDLSQFSAKYPGMEIYELLGVKITNCQKERTRHREPLAINSVK